MKLYFFSIPVLLLIFYYCYQFLFSSGIICSSNEFETKVLSTLCQESTQTSIILPLDKYELPFSNLCSYICSSQLDVACHPFHLNKPYVFTLTEKFNHNLKIVLKSAVEEEGYEDEEYAYWKENGTNVPTHTNLEEMVVMHIEAFLGKPADEFLIPIKSLLFISPISNLSVHADFWKLIYDHEFLTNYLFHRFYLFPKILGVCKSFYAVEYAQPLLLNPYLPIDILWPVRIQKGIELVSFTEKLQTVWQEPMHLCDMKHDHFGWKNGKVLFLDLDCVITDSALKNIMANTPPCSNHEDCSYFDCVGECLPSKQCSMRRRNNNLQVLCNKIFLGNSQSSIINMYGLLTGYGMSESLKDALELCATNPGMTAEVLTRVLRDELNSIRSPSTEL